MESSFEKQCEECKGIPTHSNKNGKISDNSDLVQKCSATVSDERTECVQLLHSVFPGSQAEFWMKSLENPFNSICKGQGLASSPETTIRNSHFFLSDRAILHPAGEMSNPFLEIVPQNNPKNTCGGLSWVKIWVNILSLLLSDSGLCELPNFLCLTFSFWEMRSDLKIMRIQ